MSRRAKKTPEHDFMLQVIGLAEHYHWRWFHDWDPVRNEAGFPDLVLVKAGRVIFAELKVGNNTLETAQELWRSAITPRAANATHEYHLWYPKDMEGSDGGEIARVLGA